VEAVKRGFRRGWVGLGINWLIILLYLPRKISFFTVQSVKGSFLLPYLFLAPTTAERDLTRSRWGARHPMDCCKSRCQVVPWHANESFA
jgi:hypothetical protein